MCVAWNVGIYLCSAQSDTILAHLSFPRPGLAVLVYSALEGNALKFAGRIADYWSDKSYLVQEAMSAILNTFGDRIPAFTLTSHLQVAHQVYQIPLPLGLQATHIHAAIITKPTVGEI